MPVLDSYLFFNGNCAEAMRFYERTLGGRMEAMMTYADSPEPGACAGDSVDAKNRIMHACLQVGDRSLMASDAPPGHPSEPMSGFGLALNYPSAQEARRAFDALSQGGQVTMPMQKTFWTETFGMLTDRFGTRWMVGGGPAAPTGG
jgi:PhnB protein